MTPQRPAGIGSTAFISAGALLVFFVIQQFGGLIVQADPAIYLPLQIVFLASLWVWAAALALTDLRLDHRSAARATTAMRTARVASIASIVGPLGLAVGGFLGPRELLPISYALTFLGAGSALLVQGLIGRRSGLLRGPLPWLGIVAGIAYIIGGVGFGSSLVTMAAFMVGYNVLELGQVAYIVWAVALGLSHVTAPRVTVAEA